jgi:hypothetical protein
MAMCFLAAGSVWLSLPMMRAHAQSSTTFDSLDIALWPEFDKPAMLVIYRANLPANVQFPVSVSLPIPAGVQPNAVAQGDADGRLVDVDYTLVQEAGRAMVNLQVTSQLVWLEFYQDLQLNGSKRTFDFQWPGGLAIPSLSIEVQDPPGISGLTLSPPSTDEVVGEYGLTYKQLSLGSVGVSDQRTIRVSYTKVGEGLTVDSLQQTPLPSSTEPIAGSAPEPDKIVTWGAVGLVVILVVVIGTLYFRVWRTPPKERPPRRRHRSKSKSFEEPMAPPEQKVGDSAPLFCHECGTQAGPQDRFCRSCGTRLRR